jgi:uncharacterized protein (DUF2235 family)
MAKNILIFSDGTGQAGGLLPDERQSNVYKLFRATRCGPNSIIPPRKQLAFYDPGLGSSSDGAHIKFVLWRRIANVLAQATGLGITHNIIDCYSSIIQHWEPGDHIYLIGFSRGAYTARCVGGVLAYCGVPTNDNGKPLRRDPITARRIAREAVTKVYQHGVGRSDERYARQRKELAANFRQKYDSDRRGMSNTVPYFIGVWDTVAALGASWPRLLVLGIILMLATWTLFALLWWVALFFWPTITYVGWMKTGILIALVSGASLYLLKHVRIATCLSDPWWKTLHLRAWKMKFYDTYLNPRVSYAKHALSIDENRADFARVPWTDKTSPRMRKAKNWFEQLWFSGVHSDIGGGYPETESRLSDTSLEWMVNSAKSTNYPVLFNDRFLNLFADPTGMQHNEVKSGSIGWKEGLRTVPIDAPLHSSVLKRFEAAHVLQYDEAKPYRPEPLRHHQQVAKYYR